MVFQFVHIHRMIAVSVETVVAISAIRGVGSIDAAIRAIGSTDSIGAAVVCGASIDNGMAIHATVDIMVSVNAITAVHPGVAIDAIDAIGDFLLESNSTVYHIHSYIFIDNWLALWCWQRRPDSRINVVNALAIFESLFSIAEWRAIDRRAVNRRRSVDRAFGNRLAADKSADLLAKRHGRDDCV